MPAVSPEQQAVDKIAKQWSAGKPVSQALDKFRDKISPETFKFITSKLNAEKALSEKTPKFIRRGPKDFSLDFNGTMYSFGIKNLANGEFLVNQHVVKISGKDYPEVTWKKVERALNISSQAGLIDLVLPRAEAVAIIVGVALIAVAVGIAVYVANDYKCEQIESAISDCQNKILDFVSENYSMREPDPKKQILSAKRTVKKLEATNSNWLGYVAVCKETPKDLKACIDKLVEQGKTTLKVDLRHVSKHPNVSADSDPDAADGFE